MRLDETRAGLLISVVCLCFCLSAVGCGARQKAFEAMALSNMKELAKAILDYKKDKHAWPDNLEQLKGRPNLDLATLMKNRGTGDDPAYEYVKPVSDNVRTIILYQLRNGNRDTTLPVAYSDGSIGQLTNN